MKFRPIIMILALLLTVGAAFAAGGPLRDQVPLMVTATATDTTITSDRSTIGAQIYPFDGDMWLSYLPDHATPFKIPADQAYTISIRFDSVTLHRSASGSTATSTLVTVAKE